MKVESNDTEILDAVDEAVQATLVRLDPLLRGDFPELSSRAGRTTGKTFALCSYRSFAVDSSERAERMVAQVTLRRNDRGYLVSGDVCGESSGDILHEIPSHVVDCKLTEIVDEAKRAAEGLLAQVDLVREGLQDLSRMV